MVIHESKPKEPVAETPDEAKQRLLDELASYPLPILSLAYVYATNFEVCGADVTQRWIAAQQQTDILQQVYNKGYEDALAKSREKEEYPLGRNDWQE